jgi:hypothetical protein
MTTLPYNESAGGVRTPPKDQEFAEELDLLDSSGAKWSKK